MVKPVIKCGNSAEVFNAAPVAEPEVAPVRIVTRMHVGSTSPVARGFRVVARLKDGASALVVAADTRAEACEIARKRARELPVGTTRLVLEKWEGGDRFGQWVELATRAGELPMLARSPGRRPLSGRARRLIERWWE